MFCVSRAVGNLAAAKAASSLPILFHILRVHRSPPVAHQVILEPGIGQFREFEPRRVHRLLV